ncbi:hypothetical protein [Actinomadura sp. NTSP31]|uniref:hypothetical protein n=1 Tax=Actinomadura sp. NTSP31 TaxID=1735447 RepID=UPI0035C04783
MTKNVSVTLQGIKCVAVGPDPGSALEIYGDLGAKRTTINENGDFEAIENFPLWHLGPHDWVNIARDNTLTVNNTTPTFKINEDEWLWVGGHLAEEDDWPSNNDNLGFLDKKLGHDQVDTGQQIITFSEEGQVAEARFMVRVI